MKTTLTTLSRRLWQMPVLYATLAIFALSFVVQPRSVDAVALNSMLPFAAILAIAAVGQTLVVQQRGIDLSVAGTMTLSAVIVSKEANSDADLWRAIVIALVVACVIGIVLGVIVTFLEVTPLIATFGMSAILSGVVLAYSGGIARRVPDGLSQFALDKTLEVSNTVWASVIVVAIAAVLMSKTVVGRRFVAVGAGFEASRAAGLRVRVIRSSAYVGASLLYAIGGIILAGYLGTPNLHIGDEYTLPAIAAVVVGGTLFSGGKGRMVGTAIAALFLSQLNQFVVSIGLPTSTQFIVQGLVIAAAAVVQSDSRRFLVRLFTGARRSRKRRTKTIERKPEGADV